MAEGPAKLYVILGSHACRTGMLMLDHKEMPYELTTIPTGWQRMLPLIGFPGGWGRCCGGAPARGRSGCVVWPACSM